MRAVVLGVSGLTGRAIAAELADAGWDVVGTGRDGSRFPDALRARVRFVRSDRHDAEQLRELLASGADAVIDCLCYTAQHARALVDCRAAFGSAVVLSSKAVYIDDGGRHSNSDQPPRFGGAVSEQQPVLAPDWSGAFASREGYGPNKVAAERTLLDCGAAISILRPSLIHGPGAACPREWFVVKRLLDGRRQIPLAQGGRTGNHPTAAANLARLVRVCAQRPGRRVLNAADPDTPTAREVVEAIAAACGRPVQIVGLGEDAPPKWGWSPWGNWPPFFLDTAAATELGYEPVGTYAQTVAAAVHELRSLSREQVMRLGRAPYFAERFDYEFDEAALASAFR
ncbi:MAG: NAD-dependent epimerase/dehydratase family protein [Solirubrobacteraceae bacterium]